MKKIFRMSLLLLLTMQFTACDELQKIAENLPQEGLSNEQIAGGLKEALNYRAFERLISQLTQF